MSATGRALDVNRNRAVEALRVLEDVGRFVLADAASAAGTKRIRHGLREALSDLDPVTLAAARDAESDPGRPGRDPVGAAPRGSLLDLVVANSSRLQESLRVLEELRRLDCGAAAAQLETLRYEAYTLTADLQLKVRRHDLRERLRAEPLCLLVGPGEGAPALGEQLDRALEGGCRFFQLRMKKATEREVLDAAGLARERCRAADAVLVVNDRIGVAASLALGLHVGQEDLPPRPARAILGASCALGVSIHSRAELDRTLAEGAAEALDYCGVGTIFSSPTKPELGSAGTDLLAQLRPHCPLPIFAIGGVTAANAERAAAAGADGVAVSSAIRDAADPAAETARVIAAVQAGLARRSERAEEDAG